MKRLNLPSLSPRSDHSSANDLLTWHCHIAECRSCETLCP